MFSSSVTASVMAFAVALTVMAFIGMLPSSSNVTDVWERGTIQIRVAGGSLPFSTTLAVGTDRRGTEKAGEVAGIPWSCFQRCRVLGIMISDVTLM
jgi:hypothetical protein